jgi:preprotein translocase subunit SecF
LVGIRNFGVYLVALWVSVEFALAVVLADIHDVLLTLGLSPSRERK